MRIERIYPQEYYDARQPIIEQVEAMQREFNRQLEPYKQMLIKIESSYAPKIIAIPEPGDVIRKDLT